jgi:hypothetical protein
VLRLNLLMAYCECLSISVGEKYFCKISNYSLTGVNTELCNKLGSCLLCFLFWKSSGCHGLSPTQFVTNPVSYDCK